MNNKEDLRPAYEEFIDIIKRQTKEDDSLNHVLKIMKSKIESQIKQMSKPQLVEAFAEAIYSIYCSDRWLDTQDASIEHFKKEYSRWKLTAEHIQEELKAAPKKARSESGKNAANIRHAKNKKNKEARERKIQGIWAEGNFSTRDLCAEEEYLAAGFNSFGSARTALRNTPDPSPWPAKK